MDRVKLHLLERAELSDTLALQNLVYEHIKRHTGQLIGAGDMTDTTAGGLLSHPVPTVDANQNCTFGSFCFLGLSRGDDAPISGATTSPIAHVSRFDSSAQGHVNHPLDLSGSNVGAQYFIYARPVLIETDSAARRQFSVVTAQEVGVTLTTRERERIEFVSLKSPSLPSGDGWVKILGFTVAVDGVITFSPISAWDESIDKALPSFQSPAITAHMIQTDQSLSVTARDNSHTLGASEILALIRGQLARIIHQGAGDADTVTSETNRTWLSPPDKSIRQLTTDHAAQTTAIATNALAIGVNNDAIANLSNSIGVLQAYVLGRRDVVFRVFGYWASTGPTASSNLITTRSITGDDIADDVLFDARVIAGASGGLGSASLTAPQFRDLISKPCVSLSSSAGTWELLDYQVNPVVRDLGNTPTNSMTGNSAIQNPERFTYALCGEAYSTGGVTPNHINPRTNGSIFTGAIGDQTNPSALIQTFYGVRFALNLADISLVNNEYQICYDIRLQVRLS